MLNMDAVRSQRALQFLWERGGEGNGSYRVRGVERDGGRERERDVEGEG